MFTRKIRVLAAACLSCIALSGCGDTVDDGEGKDLRYLSEMSAVDSISDCQAEVCESEISVAE